MAVRFLPIPDPNRRPETSNSGYSERGDLAEVIELRARLPHPAGTRRAQRFDVTQDPADDPSMDEVYERAKADGVRLLARKAMSSGELRRELLSLGHEHRDIDQLTVEFADSIYLDDAGFARLLVERLRERRRASRMQIRRTLMERLVPDSVIDDVLGDLDEETETELLHAAARDRATRLVSLDRMTAERRLLGFLARRGWSGQTALSAARSALDEAGAGDH